MRNSYPCLFHVRSLIPSCRFPERVQFNFILATFGDGGSLLSGFRSGHNLWTLLSGGGGRALLSEFYGTFKRC